MSAIRTTVVRQARLFSTSPNVRKSFVQSAKDTMKEVDRAVSDAAVKGIETGEKVAEVAKKNLPTSGEVKGKANELSGQAKGKANEVKGQAAGKKEEIKGEAKGKMNY